MLAYVRLAPNWAIDVLVCEACGQFIHAPTPPINRVRIDRADRLFKCWCVGAAGRRG
jgi:hypothetical protein